SPAAPIRKLVAVCWTEMAVDRWLGRLRQWAAERAAPDNPASLIPTYEVASVDGLADLDVSRFVGQEYLGARAFEQSLRKMTPDARLSQAAVRRELRRRG